MNKTSDKTIEQSDKVMSVVPALVMINTNGQVIILKSMIPDPGWFNGNRMKFED